MTLQEELENIKKEVSIISLKSHNTTTITKRLPERLEKLSDLMLSSTIDNPKLHHLTEVHAASYMKEAASIFRQMRFVESNANPPFDEVLKNGQDLAQPLVDEAVTLFINQCKALDNSILSKEVL
jgi:hypothetical protein